MEALRMRTEEVGERADDNIWPPKEPTVDSAFEGDSAFDHRPKDRFSNKGMGGPAATPQLPPLHALIGPVLADIHLVDNEAAREIKKAGCYTRPQHPRVFCNECDDHPDGFRGEHELRRHYDRAHNTTRKVWVIIQNPDTSGPIPEVPLAVCKACRTNKKYHAYYNAAAHLRRAHFSPKKLRGKGKDRSVGKEKPRGQISGDTPPMDVLRMWMKEVEERADGSIWPLEEPTVDNTFEDDSAFDHRLKDRFSNKDMGAPAATPQLLPSHAVIGPVLADIHLTDNKVATWTKEVSCHTRPPRPQMFCDERDYHTDDYHPDGFRGGYELRRHNYSVHYPTGIGWVIIQNPDTSGPIPEVPLANCEACQNNKRYYVYYNAVAHLRRAHFHTGKELKGKGKVSLADKEKPWGQTSGDTPMDVLRMWIKPVEEREESRGLGDEDAACYSARGVSGALEPQGFRRFL